VKFANTDGESDGAGGVANAPPSDNVYVKGLPPSWTHDDLKAYFTHFGHIVECRLLHANRSTSSGALIRFLRESEATAAVMQANGRMLAPNGPPLVVRYAEAQGKHNKRSTQVNSQRLSNNTDDSAHDENELIDVFSSSMNLNRISSHSGLTELLSVGPQDGDDFAALAVLGSSPSHKFDTSVQSHQNSASVASLAPGGATMCIQNLPPAADELFMYKTFSPFGAINSIQVVRDDWTGLCSGVAVIKFRSYSDACDAQRASHKSGLSITLQSQTTNRANF
jgi:ELAV like protein 2/3/4